MGRRLIFFSWGVFLPPFKKVIAPLNVCSACLANFMATVIFLFQARKNWRVWNVSHQHLGLVLRRANVPMALPIVGIKN